MKHRDQGNGKPFEIPGPAKVPEVVPDYNPANPGIPAEEPEPKPEKEPDIPKEIPSGNSDLY